MSIPERSIRTVAPDRSPLPIEPEPNAPAENLRMHAATLVRGRRRLASGSYRESWGAPLTDARLSPPPVRTDWIERPVLRNRLNGSGDTRLVLIEAPSGYGKTTLAAQWVADRPGATAWLTLSRGEATPETILSTLLVSAERSLSESSESVGEAVAKLGALSESELMVALIRRMERAGEPMTIVIDDYQTIESPAAREAVNLFVQHLPAPHRCMVISSGAASLAVARMRAHGQVIELGAFDLALSRDESRELLIRSRAPQLTLGEIEEIVDLCDGWVAGLRLFVHYADRRAVAAKSLATELGSTQLDDYFSEVVFSTLDPALQSFMVETAFLDRFSVPLCEYVLQRAGAMEAIDELQGAGVYLFGPDSDGWYHYHRLFAQFLRSQLRLRRSDEAISAGHRRASLWFEHNRLREEAARHAVAGQDWDRAVRFIEELAGDHWRAGRLGSIRVWVEHLPPEITARSADLSYWLSGALALSGNVVPARRALSDAETIWTRSGKTERLARSRKMHSLLALTIEDAESAVTAAQSALDLLDESSRMERCRATILLGSSLARLGQFERAAMMLSRARSLTEGERCGWIESGEVEYGWLLLEQGRLSEAASLLKHLTTPTSEAQIDRSIRAQLGLARIELERDLLPSAETALGHAQRLIGQVGENRNLAMLHLIESQVAWASGDAERALDAKEKAKEISKALGSRFLLRQVRAQEARFWIDRGEFQLVRRWADEAGLVLALPGDYRREFELFTLLQGLLAQGRGPDILLAADHMLKSSEEMGREGAAAALRTIRALVLFEQGEQVQAAALMSRALQWAERERSIRTVTQYGQRIVPLLQFVSSSSDSESYSSYLAAEAMRTPLTQSVAVDGDNRLTPRELEVLRLVATGKSNRVIGDRLYISEGTVKKHLASILTKMKADNRTEAVANARRLGVI